MFITNKEKSALKKFIDKMERNFLYLSMASKEQLLLHNTRQLNKEDNRKWAYIKVANTRFLCYVDNKTMKAYKADHYKSTYIEIKKFTFERWATGFDL